METAERNRYDQCWGIGFILLLYVVKLCNDIVAKSRREDSAEGTMQLRNHFGLHFR